MRCSACRIEIRYHFQRMLNNPYHAGCGLKGARSKKQWRHSHQSLHSRCVYRKHDGYNWSLAWTRTPLVSNLQWVYIQGDFLGPYPFYYCCYLSRSLIHQFHYDSCLIYLKSLWHPLFPACPLSRSQSIRGFRCSSLLFESQPPPSSLYCRSQAYEIISIIRTQKAIPGNLKFELLIWWSTTQHVSYLMSIVWLVSANRSNHRLSNVYWNFNHVDWSMTFIWLWNLKILQRVACNVKASLCNCILESMSTVLPIRRLSYATHCHQCTWCLSQMGWFHPRPRM